ncbi:MAG: phage portal protein [Candidatus Neomicrothrix subdominans]
MPFLSGQHTRATAPAGGPRNAVDRWEPGTGLSSANGFGYAGTGPHPLAGTGLFGDHYEALFRCQPWANAAIRKLTSLQCQLPRKVYQRRRRGREDARRSPYGQLIARPSSTMDPYRFWSWFVLQYHLHGRSFALKERDSLGRPVQLHLVHPSRMRYGPPGGGWVAPSAGGMPTRRNGWWFRDDDGQETAVDRSSFVYWSRLDPAHPLAGVSLLEPLRDTLAMEAAARAASRSLLERGGKHSLILKAPKLLAGASAAVQNLADQYERRHGGIDNRGRPLILEAGMEAIPLDQSPSDMEYIQGRKLNRGEVAAVADLPPPAIHILDDATYSNITTQLRMVYQLSMPPHLTSLEATLDFDLRDGRFGEDREPDFGDAFYFEHLVDGVLRGTPEERIAAHAQAIQTGQEMPSEARELENRPFVEGSDRLFVNSAMVTIEAAASTDDLPPAVERAAAAVGAGGSPAAAALTETTATGPGLTTQQVDTLMGRLGRVGDLAQLDERFVAGLDEERAAWVQGAVAVAVDVADLKDLIKRSRA